MVTRRLFLGMLAALPVITALAGAGLRLPRREDIDGDFDIAALRYKATERYSNSFTDWRGLYGTDALNQLRDNQAFVTFRR